MSLSFRSLFLWMTMIVVPLLSLSQKNTPASKGLSVDPLPEQDCADAIPIVCQLNFSYGKIFSGNGLKDEINPNGTCLTTGELNSVWFRFNVLKDGVINFLINPYDVNDDFDWALFNITGKNCSNIFNTPSMLVSCNYSGYPGATGTNQNGFLSSQGQSGTPFNKPITVKAGQSYVLLVNNQSGKTGFSIDFDPSADGVIVDATPPATNPSTYTISCKDMEFEVSFNEKISCATVASNGSDLKITDENGVVIPVASVSPINCDADGLADKVKVVLRDPLARKATLKIEVLNGTDNNSISDKCSNFMKVSAAIATVGVTEDQACNAQIPNVITPNGDNENEFFRILTIDPNIKLNIYNRWGGRVYESDNYDNSWNASDVMPGVYYYIARFSGGNFETGTITVMK